MLEVTNLQDSGSGSLRAAVEASGPRTVVFRVGGTIAVLSSITVSNPFLTIAGQTAPGDGIALRNDPGNTNSTLHIKTHDVIVRHLRVRPGPSTDLSCCLGAVSIHNSQAPVYNVMIDHVSASWATDQVFTTWNDVHDITIQRSIISEGLHKSTHEKGPHSKGWSLGGTERISVVRNLFAHNVERSPLVSTSGVVDLVNNVIYNPGFPIMLYDTGPAVNVIKNYLKYGPNTPSHRYEVRSWDLGHGKGATIYVEGNIGPHRPEDHLANDLIVYPDSKKYLTSTSFGLGNYSIVSATQAYDDVLDDVGATKPNLDSVDLRIIDEVQNGDGSFIDNPSQVGGWPTLVSGTPPSDADHDGMPDSWEVTWGLNPNDDSDGPLDSDGDGYTNLEEYLNGSVAILEDTIPPKAPTNLRTS